MEKIFDSDLDKIPIEKMLKNAKEANSEKKPDRENNENSAKNY